MRQGCRQSILMSFSPPAEHQEWRLSGGRDGCAGRVEVFFRGTWSTVCDSTWYDTEGRVLCRTLGCGEPLRKLFFHHTLPGRMVYECESLQPSLAHCRWAYNKSAPCHQSRAVGVVCNGTEPPASQPRGRWAGGVCSHGGVGGPQKLQPNFFCPFPPPCPPPARLPGLAGADPRGHGDAEQRHPPER